MIDLKLNKKRLAMHWHYYSWRYAVCILVALGAVNFLFTATKPETPADKRVDIVVVSGALTGDITDEWSRAILRALPPDQLEVNVTTTPLMDGQESTIYQLIAARLSAGEGSIWILPRDLFQSYAVSGAFRPLDGEIDNFILPEGTDLSKGKVAVQPDESTAGVVQLCGIPLDKCTGLAEMFIPTDMVLAFPAYADKNIANDTATVNWMLSKTDEPMLLSGLSAAEKVTISIQAESFRAANADLWQSEILKILSPGTQAVSVSLDAYYPGRESFSAGLIADDIKTGAGSAWIVPRAVFAELAQAGVLKSLDDEVADYRITEGTDLSAGKAAIVKDDKAGETHQYGIPLDKSQNLGKLAAPDGMMLVFPAWSRYEFNYENTKTAVNWLLTTELAPEKEAKETK